jgi:hypothetical protein
MLRICEVFRGTCPELDERLSMKCLGNSSPSSSIPTCVIGKPFFLFFRMIPADDLRECRKRERGKHRIHQTLDIASQMKFRFSHLHEAIGILFRQTFLVESFTTQTSSQPKRLSSVQHGAGRLFLVCIMHCSPFYSSDHTLLKQCAEESS